MRGFSQHRARYAPPDSRMCAIDETLARLARARKGIDDIEGWANGDLPDSMADDRELHWASPEFSQPRSAFDFLLPCCDGPS